MTISVTDLIVPTIALCILAVMADRLIRVLQEIMHRIPKLPNEFWGPVSYVLAFLIGIVVCSEGKFNYFSYYGFGFTDREGWIFTSLLLSGGTKIVRESFGLINSMPQVISTVYSTISDVLSSTADTSATIEQTDPDNNQAGDL